jgi:conjugal transfer pilus assembly protein TraW
MRSSRRARLVRTPSSTNRATGASLPPRRTHPARLLPLLGLCLVAASPLPGRGAPGALPPSAPPEHIGPVWPIAEEDLRAVILARLKALLPEIRQGLQASLGTYRAPFIPRPTTPTGRSLTLDPTVPVAADVTTPDGHRLAHAGDRLNPGDVLPLRRIYLVINGADPRQLAWAAEQVTAAAPRPTTVLLTEGTLPAAAAALPPGIKLFPAPAALFARFPIESVPARLSRAGPKIRLDLVGEDQLP